MSGTVAILNVAAGDTKLTFDSADPAERKKAARVVKDMIRRGFVLLIEVGSDEKGPLYRRATDFDETTSEYIIAGTASDTEPQHEKAQEQAAEEATAPAPRTRSAGGRQKAAARRVPAATTSAVAVARTAGG